MKVLGTEYNPVSGLTTRYIYTLDGRLVIQALQDVEPILKENRKALNARSAKTRKFNLSEGLGTRVASIPLGFVEKVLKERGLNLFTCSDEELRKIINDIDYSDFRVAHGRV